MYAWNNQTWSPAKGAPEFAASLADVGNGMIAGTRVATAMGWRPIEAVSVGDQVLTFDKGMQTVTAIRREHVQTSGTLGGVSNWPLRVPKGALGNLEEMSLPRRQAILIESDVAEEMFGDAFTLVPVAALEGFRGIEPVRPADFVEVITLQFEEDQVVFGKGGFLFYCPPPSDIMQDLFSEPKEPRYHVLPKDKAELLISVLEYEDAKQD